jgi:cytochrome b
VATTDRPHDLVWDWPLRACHWLLVVCVAGAWATHYAGLSWFDWHRRFGYVALVLVAFRIVWGVVGPYHARFGSFVRAPRDIAEYLRGRGSWRHPAGHNPLGALSVLTLLGLLAVQAVTGLFANDDVASTGPFVGWVSGASSGALTRVHRLNSKLLLAMVALHVLAVLYYELVRGERLVRAIFTGRKPGATGIDSSRGWLALAIVIVLATALAAALHWAPDAAVSFD